MSVLRHRPDRTSTSASRARRSNSAERPHLEMRDPEPPRGERLGRAIGDMREADCQSVAGRESRVVQHGPASRRRWRDLLLQLCWGRWPEGPDGVRPTAAAPVGLRDRHCGLASSHPCFPHPIRPFGPPSPSGDARRAAASSSASLRFAIDARRSADAVRAPYQLLDERGGAHHDDRKGDLAQSCSSSPRTGFTQVSGRAPLLPRGEGGRAIGRRKTPVFRRAVARPDEGLPHHGRPARARIVSMMLSRLRRISWFQKRNTAQPWRAR